MVVKPFQKKGNEKKEKREGKERGEKKKKGRKRKKKEGGKEGKSKPNPTLTQLQTRRCGSGDRMKQH